MTNPQREFVTFVIGNLAARLVISESQAYNMLNNAAAIRDYIVPAYDVLHTFSRDYIIDDIIDYIKEKGVLPC